jgi:ribokinase
MPLPSKWRSLQVVVIGTYNTKLIVWCDAIPLKGQSMLGGDFEMFCGGIGAPCAVAAARAGCQVQFVRAPGRHAFGKLARARQSRERIDISDFVALPRTTPGVALVFQ